jgi:hypothetical protein
VEEQWKKTKILGSIPTPISNFEERYPEKREMFVDKKASSFPQYFVFFF